MPRFARSLFRLPLFFGLACGITIWNCGPPRDKNGQAITHGTFRLRTFPSGARVWIEGELKVESTPATLVLKAGSYALRLQAPGAEALETSIRIKAGQHQDRTINIPKPAPASISVFSDLVGAKVRINGYVRGRTPLFRAITRPGPIDLNVIAPGGQAKSVRTELSISENKFLQLFFFDVACAPEEEDGFAEAMSRPIPHGQVTLAFRPAGKIFDQDNKEIGNSPLRNHRMAVGIHKLRLESKNKAFSRWVKIEVEAKQNHIFRFRLGDADKIKKTIETE